MILIQHEECILPCDQVIYIAFFTLTEFYSGKAYVLWHKGREYNWMEAYLTERRQFVTVNDCTSHA